MSTITDDDAAEEGIVFTQEDDGSVTAKDLETGLARGGDTRAEALAGLAEILILEEGGGKPINDPDEFLEEELDIDVDELEEHDQLPEFMQ